MNKNEFIQKFQLSTLQASTHLYRHHKSLKAAAVLIAITEKDGHLSIVFTKRASHLKHHPNQISFPGGKTESFDKNTIATAIREAEEEIGLNAQAIEIIGQLPPYQVISGYLVTPVIAFISNKQNYIIDHNEVAEIFQVPLQHFLNTENHITITVERQGNRFPIQFMPYNHHNIWGATAAMLKDLANHLND
jgi:8-oxo-dGTP pyrophosphatase MutT (NUDIX family)